MLLVVFGHLTERTQVLRILTYSFHMPLFFIISGLFLNMKKNGYQSIKKDVFKFILPAYEVLIFDIIIKYSRCLLAGRVEKPLLIDWGKGALLYGGVLWNSPVWFLLTLFLCKYLFIFLYQLQPILPYVCALLCIGVNCTDINNIFPSWWPFNVVMAFPFLVIGVLAKPYKKSVMTFKAWRNIPLTALWIVLSLYNGYTDIHIQMNGKSYLLLLITGTLGSYLCIQLSSMISKTNLCGLFECVGHHSFIVLITHYYICRGLIPFILNYFNIEVNIWMQCFMSFVIILLYYGLFLNNSKLIRKRSISTRL